jgi:AcrR family transcriptional regulator
MRWETDRMGSQAADPPGRGPLESKSFPRGALGPSERERLMDAMAASCTTRGYAQTSIEDVVREARLSREAFDRTFASKEECALAAIDSILAEALAAAGGAYSPDCSQPEWILRGVKALMELMAARPSYAHLAYIESRQTMPQEAYEIYTSGMHILAAALDRLRAQITPDAAPPPNAARGALGSAEVIIRRELIAGRAERLPDLLPDIVYGALVPFLDQQEAIRYAGLARELLNEGG